MKKLFSLLLLTCGLAAQTLHSPSGRACEQFNSGVSCTSAVVAGVQLTSTTMSLQSVVSTLVASNTLAFTNDGSPYFRAAPGYPACYIDDTTLAMIGAPAQFIAPQVLNIISKFVFRVSNGSGTGGNSAVAGEIPMALNPDGTVFVFNSAWDLAHLHSTDPMLLAQLELLYWQKTGVTTQWTTDKSVVTTALSDIPRDGTTGLVKVVPGQEWVPWAFEEMPRKTGFDAMGSLMYWQNATAVAFLAGQAGDSATQTTYTTQANLIKTSLQNTSSSSPLWDAAVGMLFAASTQNVQDDILASSYGCHLGVLTANQCLLISQFLSTNFNFTEYHGYFLQTPISWNPTGFIASGGGTPYTPQQGPLSYQSAFWSVGNQWILEVLYLTDKPHALKMMNDFAANGDPTEEYYAPFGSPTSGNTSNLESPVGTAQFALQHPNPF